MVPLTVGSASIYSAARKVAGTFVLLWAAATFAAQAQTFTTLVSFNYTNGAYPQSMCLVQGNAQ
jgi:hypothetical protein